jgi:multiple sugar transport system ATP-binding protein
MAQIVLDQVTKTYRGGVNGVDDLSLDIADGGVHGPRRPLRLREVDRAALHRRPGGDHHWHDLHRRRVVNDVPPKDRDVAMVFQNYALYPHMSVEQNLEFGLRQRKTSREEIRRRVTEVAQMRRLEAGRPVR